MAFHDPRWDGLIEPGDIARLDGTRFLTRCREGSVSRAELREFVLQQYCYARHFTRYLCALLSNLSDEGDRTELTENLLEEIGFGPGGKLPHAQIYRDMMRRMGLDPASASPSPATERLVDEMFAACRHPNPLVGLGALCLGAEAIVPYVYGQVVSGFLARGESEENLEFFRLHIEEDDAHAITMRKIIERRLAESPLEGSVLKTAASRVIAARAAFFDAIGSGASREVARANAYA